MPQRRYVHFNPIRNHWLLMLTLAMSESFNVEQALPPRTLLPMWNVLRRVFAEIRRHVLIMLRR